MKIQRPVTQEVARTYAATQRQVSVNKPVESKAEVTKGRTDEFELSASAAQALDMRKRLKEAPEVRADLVARLKAEVEAGTYNVSPEQVAERVLRSGVLNE